MAIYTEDFNVSIVTPSGCIRAQGKGAVGKGRLMVGNKPMCAQTTASALMHYSQAQKQIR